MIEPWNNALLEPPPVNTFMCKDTIDIKHLRNILEDVTEVLSNQSALHHEGAIISRLIYKYDKKFRNDIGYRNLKMVNTALRRYLKLDLSKVVDYFYCIIPLDDSNDEYLPTRQMLEYVLVRLQSFSKLMVRLCVCSKKAAIFYWDRVTRGESHWMSLMPYAVVCRIWSMTLVLLKQSCKWYTRLHVYWYKLQPVGLQYLPEGYSLPTDIEKWLDMPNLDEHGKFHWSRNKCIEVLSSLEEEDIDDAMDIFQYIQNLKSEINEVENDAPSDNDSSPEKSEEVQSTNIDSTGDMQPLRKRHSYDLGESISRGSFKKLAQEGMEILNPGSDNIKKEEINVKKTVHLDKKIVHPSNQMHSTDTVTNEKEMKVFIAKEDRLRNNGNKQSLSSHLGFMQWQSLKTAAYNLYDVGHTDEVICKKFKKLWKRKCTNYL